jgi:hypothetical protein
VCRKRECFKNNGQKEKWMHDQNSNPNHETGLKTWQLTV